MRCVPAPRSARCRQRGYSLLELMIAVWLLGVLVLAMASVQTLLLRHLRKADPAVDPAVELALCSRALVADARRSSSYEWAGDARVSFRWKGGRTVTWRQEGDLIIREEKDGRGEVLRTRSWRGVDDLRHLQGGPRLFVARLGTDTAAPRVVSGALRGAP